MKSGLIVAVTVCLSIVVGFLTPFLIAAVTLGAVFAFPAAEAPPDPRGEYYRAIYDMCVYQTGQREMCRRAIAGYIEHNWYEDPSPGWTWPIPTPTPNPTGQRLNG